MILLFYCLSKLKQSRAESGKRQTTPFTFSLDWHTRSTSASGCRPWWWCHWTLPACRRTCIALVLDTHISTYFSHILQYFNVFFRVFFRIVSRVLKFSNASQALRQLRLEGCPVEDPKCAHIKRCHLDLVTQLHMDYNWVTPQWLMTLGMPAFSQRLSVEI